MLIAFKRVRNQANLLRLLQRLARLLKIGTAWHLEHGVDRERRELRHFLDAIEGARGRALQAQPFNTRGARDGPKAQYEAIDQSGCEQRLGRPEITGTIELGRSGTRDSGEPR